MQHRVTEKSRDAIQAAVKACHKRSTLKCRANGFRYDEDRGCMIECECRVNEIVGDALSHFQCHRPLSLGESRIQRLDAVTAGSWFFSGNQNEWVRDVYNVLARHVRDGHGFEYCTSDDIISAEFREGNFSGEGEGDRALKAWNDTELLIVYLFARNLYKDRGPTHIHTISQARKMNGLPTWVFFDGDEGTMKQKFGAEFAGLIYEKGNWKLEKF